MIRGIATRGRTARSQGTLWRAAAGSLIALTVLTGCSTGKGPAPEESAPSPSATETPEATTIAPVIVPIDRVGGTTVEVPRDTTLVLRDRSEHFAGWTAAVADPRVAEFVPGADHGSF